MAAEEVNGPFCPSCRRQALPEPWMDWVAMRVSACVPSQACLFPFAASHLLQGRRGLFCQGDLFNHLIFWWPFIPRYHGYGPIKGRSNKAASQTGNKNIKSRVRIGREGRVRSETKRTHAREIAGSVGGGGAGGLRASKTRDRPAFLNLRKVQNADAPGDLVCKAVIAAVSRSVVTKY